MSYISGFGFLNVKEVGPQPPDDVEVWWRADDRRYANYDPFAEFEQPSGSKLVIELTPFEVVKHTPKGARVRDFLGWSVQVLGNAIRQHAVPTKELALQDLVRRKEKHVKMAEMRAEEARSHLKAAQKALELERCK